MLNLQTLRRQYALHAFSETEAADSPFDQFKKWFHEAVEAQLLEPNAMTLATATHLGHPSARIVLLKEVDAKGFVFFTNYESRKGAELTQNPYAALLFNWMELERQVRIEGSVEKISAEESLAYFQSRPKGSQIGAWASPQSRILNDRAILDKRVSEISAQYADADALPLPPFWGGYRVLPEVFEFWQGRESRLHDRVRYHRESGNWVRQRLAP